MRRGAVVKTMSLADCVAAVVIIALAVLMMFGVRKIFRQPLAGSAAHTAVAHPYMP